MEKTSGQRQRTENLKRFKESLKEYALQKLRFIAKACTGIPKTKSETFAYRDPIVKVF